MQMQTRMDIFRSRYRLLSLVLFLGLGSVAVASASNHTQAQAEAPVQPTAWALAHQAWSTDNGLPQNSVHQILQTRDGYIWIATEGGVARFNGTQFTVFNQEYDPAFTSNDTVALPKTGAVPSGLGHPTGFCDTLATPSVDTRWPTACRQL